MKITAVFPPLNEASRLPVIDSWMREFEWDAPTENPKEALDLAFREFNIVQEGDSHIARECRSMSVGDAIKIEGKIYICDLYGWKSADHDFFDMWIHVPFSTRLLGPGMFDP